MNIGLCTLDITPPFPMPMGGFAGRADHFDCVHDPLLLSAIFVESEGREAWIVSADLVQFPDGEPFEAGIARISGELGCGREALFLNASHTHGGPLMFPGFGVDSLEKRLHRSEANCALVHDYFEFLWSRIVEACKEARSGAKPGRLVYGEGTTTFPMNRRALVNGRIENAPNPDGPIDNRLRLLGVEDLDGRLLALGLVLAAHPTSTGRQHRITADYVGAWREAFRQAVGDEITPFFLQACGADTRPAFTSDGDRWKKVPLGDLAQMGRHLLRETFDVMRNGLSPLEGPEIRAAFREIVLPCQHWYSSPEQCRKLLNSASPWERDFAVECLRRLECGESIHDRISLRLHVLKLADDFILLGLGCEPLCALGWKIEEAFPGKRCMVVGYTDGCFGYVPESEELARGGYETETYLWEPLSGPFEVGVENLIIDGFRKLMENLQS